MDVNWLVYVIADRRAIHGPSLVEVVRAAIVGGATVVQLREKQAATQDMVRLGQALHEMTRVAGIPLIVNDRVDVALAVDAEGVHVGPDDMPALLARHLIGPHRLLGVSAGTVAEARQAEQDGADYIGVGDVYGTPSKPDAGSPIGLNGLAEIARSVKIPAVGVGGITPDNALAVIQAGAKGVAVISAVMGAPDPRAAASRLRAALEAARTAM
ncbi:MAG: thiamine phosphate synthase [Aggregatilineales bacterium]